MLSSSPDISELTELQFSFANHIRQPDRHPKPLGVERRRMAIYNDLFYNNMESFLADSFPVLRSIMADQGWHAMARDFFARHACKTPLFTRLAEEFLGYLRTERNSQQDEYPFFYELAHYEWVELALTLSDADLSLPQIDEDGDVRSAHPMVSPLAWMQSYDYAVHRIGPDYLPDQPQISPTHLLVYRDRQDKIAFLEVNPVTHDLLGLLQNNPVITGEEAVKSVVSTLNHPAPARATEAGCHLLLDLQRRGILLVVCPSESHGLCRPDRIPQEPNVCPER